MHTAQQAGASHNKKNNKASTTGIHAHKSHFNACINRGTSEVKLIAPLQKMVDPIMRMRTRQLQAAGKHRHFGKRSDTENHFFSRKVVGQLQK